MKKITLLLILLLLFSINFSNAQYANVTISTLNSPNETTICINPKNTNQLIAGANIVSYYWSTNSGLNWTRGVMSSSSWGVWGDPIVACDTNNIFYYFHLADNVNLPWPAIDRIVCQKSTNNGYLIENKKLKPANIVMYEAGDTACENILTAAAKINGTTIIRFASANYMVQEICFFLEKLGVKIEGIGTSTLIVHGVKNINMDIEYSNSEDPIESMMFISAGIATDSELKIMRCPIDFLSLELEKLKRMGLKYKILKKYKSYNERTNLIDLQIFPSKLKALEDKIHANPYPGINMDNLPFFVPIAIKAKGQTMIHDWVYENRAIYFTELNRLGASITLADPHRVYIQGGTILKPAQVVCPPALRPAMIILIGMLGASGTSILRNVYMINRGYEEIAERLNSIGADIKILK